MNLGERIAGARHVLAVAFALGVATACRPQSAPDPASPAASPPPAAARRAAPAPSETRTDAREVYRRRAGDQAAAIRLAADGADLDPGSRKRLVGLVDDHLRAVAAEVSQMGEGVPAAERLIADADASAERFEETKLGPWAEAHPQALPSVERRFAIWEAVQQGLVNDPQRLVGAASAAGLPPDRIAEATRLTADARRRLVAWNEAGQASQDRIAALPPGDARTLAEAAFERDAQHVLFEAGRTTYAALRRLMPRDRHARFDEALFELESMAGEDGDQ